MNVLNYYSDDYSTLRCYYKVSEYKQGMLFQRTLQPRKDNFTTVYKLEQSQGGGGEKVRGLLKAYM